MGHLVTPTGKRIVATLEVIPGICRIESIDRIRGSNTNLIEHSGGTEINWNGQKTLEFNHQRMFLDEDDNEWPESLLIFINED
jgi:hypothetical protein